MKKFICLFLVVVAAVFAGCGTATTTEDATAGVDNKLVDPYIVGAVLYEDVNGNGVQDADEQTSSVTDENGGFSFDNPLTADSILRLTATKGTHNGVAYTGDIMTKVTDPTVDQVVSPLTTLLANGWTAQNIIDELTTAGLSGITAEDLTTDPMNAFNLTDTISTITDEKLANIQASITIYCFLSIIDGVIKAGYVSDLGTGGFTLTHELFAVHPYHATLLANMVTQIQMGLSKTVLENVATGVDAAKAVCAGTEDATISEIIKGSVAISNYVIPKVVASCATSTNGVPDCDWAPDTTYFNTWSMDLGKRFYVIRTASNACTTGGVSFGLLPNVLTKAYCTLEGATDAAATATCY